MIAYRLQRWPLRFSTDFNSILITKPVISLTFRNRSELISDLFKQNVYNQCKSFSERSYLFEPLQRENQKISLQDVYLLLRYSPRRTDEDGLYLQMATSYLFSRNLQQLSIQQQMRTRAAIFLSENYTNVMYKRLERWFTSIYAPYTAITHVIRTEDGNQASLEYMINYIKHSEDVQLDTILFLLEDDYIFEADMLVDTIEFFASYNPCFVYQSEYSERCRLEINDDDSGPITMVNGRTRMWRSISSITVTYACRLRTFLAFEDIVMHSKNNQRVNHDIRTRAGDTVFFCAMPSYGAHMETILLPNEINVFNQNDTEVYYKDWNSLARHALSEAQMRDTFPAPKVNEQNLFAR